MGNLFIGFPVPRAKIATMIEEAAPPLAHKENHEPPGSDPLILPDDISSGQIIKWNGTKFIGVDEPSAGMTFPWADYVWHTHLESLDGIAQSTAGSGTITLTHSNVHLYTTGSTSDRAIIYKTSDYPHIPLTWDKPRKFKTRCRFDLGSGVDARYYITIGQPLTETAIGFRLEDGVLQTYIRVPAGTETSNIEDWSGSPAAYDRNLAIIHAPPAYPKFYVDGALVYTATERLPDGTDSAKYIIYSRVYHPSSGHAQHLYLSEWMFWQGA